MEGAVLFNNAPLTKAIKKRIGFVLQVLLFPPCACSATATYLQSRYQLLQPKLVCPVVEGLYITCAALQDDLLFPSLTPFDQLHYAAMLRLPAKMSSEEKKERVEAVIDTLGLKR